MQSANDTTTGGGHISVSFYCYGPNRIIHQNFTTYLSPNSNLATLVRYGVLLNKHAHLRNGFAKTNGTLRSGQRVGSSSSGAAVVVRFLLSNACPSSSDVPAQQGDMGYHLSKLPASPCDHEAVIIDLWSPIHHS